MKKPASFSPRPQPSDITARHGSATTGHGHRLSMRTLRSRRGGLSSILNQHSCQATAEPDFFLDQSLARGSHDQAPPGRGLWQPVGRDVAQLGSSGPVTCVGAGGAQVCQAGHDDRQPPDGFVEVGITKHRIRRVNRLFEQGRRTGFAQHSNPDAGGEATHGRGAASAQTRMGRTFRSSPLICGPRGRRISRSCRPSGC